MIKELVIQNFQSHKGSILHFDKGVNVIVGSSDSGKTAIIRALRWAVTNKPSGEDFRSHWGGVTSVTVAVGESNKKVIGNKVIRRTKSDKENLYSLDETDFKAFGQSVPEEIQNAFNLTEVNLQGQLDAPFLLSSSPGEVAQHFNKVANLELIDQSIKKATNKINSLQSDLNAHEINIKKIEAKIEGFINLETCEAAITEIEEIEKTCIALETSKTVLEKSLWQIESLTKKLKEFDALLALEDFTNEIILYYTQLSEKKKEYDNLSTLLKNLTLKLKQIQTYNILIKNESNVVDILSMFSNIDDLNIYYKSLYSLLQDVKITEFKVRNMEKAIIQKEEFYKNNFPEVCPLCGK